MSFHNIIRLGQGSIIIAFVILALLATWKITDLIEVGDTSPSLAQLVRRDRVVHEIAAIGELCDTH